MITRIFVEITIFLFTKLKFLLNNFKKKSQYLKFDLIFTIDLMPDHGNFDLELKPYVLPYTQYLVFLTFWSFGGHIHYFLKSG